VVEAVELLRVDGYALDFLPEHATVCQASPEDRSFVALEFEWVYRFEGVSDPGDEAIVLGVRCPSCGGRGVVVSAYGSGAPDPALLTGFVDRRSA